MLKNKSVQRVLAAVAPLGILATGAIALAPSASAVPYQTGDKYVDCGPSICTVYWSQPQTEVIFQDTQDPSWPVVSTLLERNLLSAIVIQNSQATLANIEANANAAVMYDGCLQFAYRADGTGKGLWGYTTHPDYCWDPAVFEF
ncbi:hypothetical protein [Rhodococcoides fascians]|uniref:hypothetical protein n=1 Tax=Rhodococcoides fascians TaxID=1828 RepID=UPI00050CA9D8|nr:hypothetical protein [Rhodococcus fascians]